MTDPTDDRVPADTVSDEPCDDTWASPEPTDDDWWDDFKYGSNA